MSQAMGGYPDGMNFGPMATRANPYYGGRHYRLSNSYAEHDCETLRKIAVVLRQAASDIGGLVSDLHDAPNVLNSKEFCASLSAMAEEAEQDMETITEEAECV